MLMAAAAAATMAEQVFHDNNNNKKNGEINRQEIQAAIAKAVELRALHAALVQGNNPTANLGFTTSPVSRPASQLSAQDYPVFTPSYDDEASLSYPQIPVQSRTQSGAWDDYPLGGGNGVDANFSEYKMEISSSRRGGLASIDSHLCPVEDQKSVTGSCANNITVLQTSPRTDYFKSSRRNSLGDFKSLSSCNRCRPATITTESEIGTRNSRNSNMVAPLTDTHSSVHSQPKNRGKILSWFFPRLKKKHKHETSPNRTESEEVSQAYRDLGMIPVEALKRELIEANENRDAALKEVSEMRSSLGELKQKLEYLETYCEELKKALRLATKAPLAPEKLGNLPRNDKLGDGNGENLLPVTEEVMVEGFLQIVSEARLSVKQFCKTLIGQIEETDCTLNDNLNLLLQPYQLSLKLKYSKAVLYHLEAIINQVLYQDFENCVFQKNGSPKLLDPQQDRQAQFQSFVALRNLSWNEVLLKGTKFYSEELSRFCDQKMSCIITTLNWTKPWPEQLLQTFFVAAKCIWLLHLLAFSFNPPLGILRVEENRTFDPRYMEDMFLDRQRSQGPSRVKIMVMPGFYVQDKVLRSKVLCRYKAIS